MFEFIYILSELNAQLSLDPIVNPSFRLRESGIFNIRSFFFYNLSINEILPLTLSGEQIFDIVDVYLSN